MPQLEEALLKPEDSLLLIIDVQNDFIDSKGEFGKAGYDVSLEQAMVPTLKKLISSARSLGVNIAYTLATHSRWTDTPGWRRRLPKGIDVDNFCRPNTWGWRLYHLRHRDDELLIQKPRFSSFIGTHLDLTIKALRASSLILAGVSTSGCVEATAMNGYMLDHNVVVLSDCTADGSKTAHRTALERLQRYVTVASSAEVLESWRRSRANSQRGCRHSFGRKISRRDA